MARYANELSAIQLNPELFAGVQAKIRRFSGDYLGTLGNVSRTTIFKYNRRKPVNPTAEREILRVIALAEGERDATNKELVEEAKGLVSAE